MFWVNYFSLKFLNKSSGGGGELVFFFSLGKWGENKGILIFLLIRDFFLLTNVGKMFLIRLFFFITLFQTGLFFNSTLKFYFPFFKGFIFFKTSYLGFTNLNFFQGGIPIGVPNFFKGESLPFFFFSLLVLRKKLQKGGGGWGGLAKVDKTLHWKTLFAKYRI